MTIREQMEMRERENLSPYAALSEKSLGRDVWEPQCDIRPVYQRDRDRILHSKAFRRLKDKTQVFLSPKGDHYRTRLTHVLEVSQNARTIARALRLNEDLTEAIALGHDLGHTPFGHAGERMLNEIMEDGFQHNVQSVRIVEKLEKGKGLNLTKEVRDGMLNHRESGHPSTLEGKVVRLSDRFAYVNSDIDDAIRAHVMKEEDIPDELREILGYSVRDRLNTLIHDTIINSMGKDDICMSEEVSDALARLREFMFAHVYTNPVAKGEENRAKELLERLFEYYMDHVEEISHTNLDMYRAGESKERVICDYIAGMTDQYAVSRFKEIYVPKQWQVL